MEKMYTLTWCYEGCDDNCAQAQTIAVSNDKEKVIQKMKEWVAKDCEVNEDDEFDDDVNFEVFREYGDVVTLQHKTRTNLYTTYRINEVEVI